MSHDIHYNDRSGKHSFFSVREKPWHGLGQVVSDYPTSGEAMREAGLDYTVEKRPLFTYPSSAFAGGSEVGERGAEIAVPDFFATVRTDTDCVLGVVGRDYRIVQNGEAFTFFDAIVGGGEGILYETAGALGKGERVFITAKLPEFIRVGKGDLIEQYLFLTTSHDGYGSITAAFTPVRVVCRNTLNAVMKNNSNCIKIRHTASAQDRLKQAHKLLGITSQLAAELETVFNRWATVRITDQAVKRLIQVAMAPNKEVLQNLQSGRQDELSTQYNNLVSSVFEYAMTSPSQQGTTTKGTLFGAYNAVTGYFQNVRNYKDGEAKLKSILFGTALQRGQTAFNLCREFARHGTEALALN